VAARKLPVDKTNVPGVIFKGGRLIMRGVYIDYTIKRQYGLRLITPKGPDPKAMGNRRRQRTHD